MAPELFYARIWPHDPNAPRWNTYYKLFVSAWVLWAPGAGVAVARSVQGLRAVLSNRTQVPMLRTAATVVSVLALIGTVTFGAAAFNAQLGPAMTPEPTELTLDGTEWIEGWHPNATEPLAYLDRQPGRPTIAARPGTQLYTWVNPASSLTGIPTIVGWRHQAGYRGSGPYQARVAAVEQLFTANWTVRWRHLRHYDVRYIWVDAATRDRYGAAETDFERYPGISIAIQDGDVTLYEVDPEIYSVKGP